ncbi:hypothetical protein JQC67_03160 [Aurantibacter crassamenti]|uniref:glycerophosphodiester phosphodiesterase n=1 Tax=Aurantibacter crassamenti TaxID=1837375 RepID=UPI0019396EF5|nr:glycerophosphodiester phosphodiesterase family protein [Aurantibacter crassamenti]MBM1105131.1 hypothetical protein [Aurantibacter crassamenti]
MKNKLRYLKVFFILVSLLFFNSELFGQVEILPSQGICAHRGANKTHPENTISAFKEAIRLGAQMIEFDVQLTKDEKLIIMHDATVDRTTNGSGFVKNLTFDQLRSLDAGTWKSKKFEGEKIPTLKEVLQIMPNNIWLNIHLKGNKKLGAETAKVLIAESKMHQAFIASDKKAAKGVQKISSEIKICNMQRLSSRTKYIAKTIAKGYSFIQLKKSRDNATVKSDIENLKRHNITINYVQTDDAKEIDALLNLGIDFILTDDLEPMLEAYDSYKANL